jgi:acetolactate synthase-1/2/3 large subunit
MVYSLKTIQIVTRLAENSWWITWKPQFQTNYLLNHSAFFSYLARRLPAGTRTFFDTGNSWAWATHYYQRPESDGSFRMAMGFGAMGWAIGAAIGSSIANPKVPNVCITGDGAYLMSGQEITTAAQEKLPVVMVILNDNAYGMIMHGQRLACAEQIGYRLAGDYDEPINKNLINFAAMAESMGIEGIVIETPEQLEAIEFERLFNKNSPTIIDIRIDADEVPPMGSRIKVLNEGVDNPPGTYAGETATPGG